MSKEVGDRIRTARKKAGLTQAALAARVGMVRSAITNYERGINDPGTDALSRIAEACNVSSDELLGRAPAPRRDESSSNILRDEHGTLSTEAAAMGQDRVSAELRHAIEAAEDGDFKALALRLLDTLDMYGQNMRSHIMDVAAPMARAQEAMARAQEEAQHNIAAVAKRLPEAPPASKLGAAVISDPEEVARIRAEILSHEKRSPEQDPVPSQAGVAHGSPGPGSGRPASPPSDE